MIALLILKWVLTYNIFTFDAFLDLGLSSEPLKVKI